MLNVGNSLGGIQRGGKPRVVNQDHVCLGVSKPTEGKAHWKEAKLVGMQRTSGGEGKMGWWQNTRTKPCG